MNKKVFLVVMAGLLCSKGLLAEVQPGSFVGEEMVVTATKTLNSICNAGGSSVTVISAEELKSSGKRTVAEAIRGTSGLDVTSNGGVGTLANVFIRGADSKNTLVLVDGVPASDPANANSEANISNLSLDNVDRIEIVRGAVSFLYGSGATAGVINIITKTGNSTPEAFAGVEGGTFRSYKFYGGANGQKGHLNYAFGVSRLKIDGFSAVDDKNKYMNPTGAPFEKDGYQNTTLSGNLSWRLNQKSTLEAVLRYTDAGVAYDSSAADKLGANLDSSQLSGRVALKMNYQPVVSTLYYTANQQDRRYLDSGALSSIFNGKIYDIGWQGDFTAAEKNIVSAGLNYQHQTISNGSFGLWPSQLDANSASTSLFLQDQWHFGGLIATGGVRYEDNNKSGSKSTFRLAPSCSVGDTILKFSYGTGFRVPSLYELYSPYGNTSLKAETSAGWDAGVEQKAGDDLKLGATYFQMDYTDRIDFDMATWIYAQMPGKTKTHGVESFVEWRPAGPLFFAVNYTFTKTEDASGNELRRRPQQKVGLSGSWKASSATRLAGNIQWVGTSKDLGAKDDAGTTTNLLPAYLLAGVSGSQKLGDSVELYGRLDNLFDTWYEVAWGYATPGRSLNLGLKVNF